LKASSNIISVSPKLMNDSINSNAPTFDIGSLPSVHEHDWRDSSFIDENKTAATFTLEADVGTVEDPYSDLYRARESEGQTVEKQQHIKRQESHNSQPYQPSVQPTARTMNNGQQQRVTFEAANSATEQEVVHINAMFQPPPSTNNTGNSAQGPSDPSNYYGEQAYHSNNGYLSNNHPQMQIPQGYVPNKYSAHYDPNMPDWEGVTIAERTMADISTVTPPPDDYYNPYAPPPVAMVAAAAPGATWEELGETDAERADWRNPKYGSDEKSEPSGFSAEQSALGAKDRRLLWGLMCLVGLLVVVVAVVVPVSLNFAKNASQIQSNEATAPVGGSGVTSPSLSPSILNESASTKPGETCANPPCGEPPVQPSTVVPATDDSTDSDGPAEPATTEPAVTEPATAEPVSDGRDTDEPTPSPVAPEEDPSPSGAVPESTPDPTPEPTKEPTPEPTTQQPTESPVTDAPTPSPVDSLLTQNLNEDAKAWLLAHNTRRETYHEQYGKAYVPLVWSGALADDAQAWVEENRPGTSCSIQTQDRDDVGQTSSSYWSTSSSYTAIPEEWLAEWVEEEADLEWDENKKFTQAIWRASKVCRL
jgi:hypothetical protein